MRSGGNAPAGAKGNGMTHSEGLLHAYAVTANGTGEARTWASLDAALPEKGFLWMHLDRGAERATAWLTEESGLDPVISDALLAPETRPRCTRFDAGVLVMLRGVNLNPGAEPEDMVSLRIWIEPRRIITVRLRRLMAVEDVRLKIEQGQGPRSPMDFLAMLADRLAARMEPVIAEIDDALDDLEDYQGPGDVAAQRARVGGLRRKATQMRRFIGPQRDALVHLAGEDIKWMTTRDRQHLRETADDITRFVEGLNAAWERAAVMNDEHTNRLAEHTNRRLYLLSVVAAIFLPLGFVTGLLGINVGGIPGADSVLGFPIVIALLVVLIGLELWVLRRLGWF